MQRDPSGSTCLVRGIFEVFFLRGIRGEGLEMPVSSFKTKLAFLCMPLSKSSSLSCKRRTGRYGIGQGREGRKEKGGA